MNVLRLDMVSPKLLLNSSGLSLAVPGTYRVDGSCVRIRKFRPSVEVSFLSRLSVFSLFFSFFFRASRCQGSFHPFLTYIIYYYDRSTAAPPRHMSACRCSRKTVPRPFPSIRLMFSGHSFSKKLPLPPARSVLLPTLQVIPSKQRPRKITMQGEDGRDYVFLLKGHEDLRQDERVMQLFGQVK